MNLTHRIRSQLFDCEPMLILPFYREGEDLTRIVYRDKSVREVASTIDRVMPAFCRHFSTNYEDMKKEIAGRLKIGSNIGPMHIHGGRYFFAVKVREKRRGAGHKKDWVYGFVNLDLFIYGPVHPGKPPASGQRLLRRPVRPDPRRHKRRRPPSPHHPRRMADPQPDLKKRPPKVF